MSMFIAKLFKQNPLRPSLFNSRVRWAETKNLGRLKSSSATPTLEANKDKEMQLRDIPGPSVFENLVTLARQGFRYHHIFLEEMFERYGPIFRHSLPGIHMVNLSDPEDIEHVYRSQDNNNPYRGNILLTDYSEAMGMEKGLAGSDETWRVHRKLIAPKLLRLGVLKPYFTEILNVTDDTVANFKGGRNIDLMDGLTKWAAESVGVILFGLRIGTNYKSLNESAKAFINAVNGYFSAEAKLLLGIPFYKYVKTPTLSQAFRHLDEQIKITREFAAETRRAGTELTRISLVHRLENDDEVPDEITIPICSNLFIGGVHTTANSALRLLDTLSRHPEVQRKAYEEIRQVLGDNLEPPTPEKLSEMPYLRAVVREGNRYNAIPPGNIRVSKSPVTVRGYRIPPGTKIILSAMASKEMQRQKYGDPENFSPERWLRSTEARVHPFSSTPFGFGKRHCVGKRLADLELSLLVLRLLQKYEILENKIAEDQVKWVFQILLAPDRPYTLYLKKRN